MESIPNMMKAGKEFKGKPPKPEGADNEKGDDDIRKEFDGNA